MRCSVQNCNNDTRTTNKASGITFHLLPIELDLRAAWIESLGIQEWLLKDKSVVCSDHFHDEDMYHTKTGMRKVKSGAVPFIDHDLSEDLEAPAAFRVCRICLAIDTRLYDIRDKKLDELYLQITGIFVREDDRLPLRVCWECVIRVRSAHALRCKAQRAHNILSDALLTHSYITIRHIKSINRAHHQLQSSLIRKIYENHDADLHVNHETIKSESNHDSELEYKNNRPEYNDNQPEYSDNGPEYTDNRPEYNDNGPECNDNGLEYVWNNNEVKDPDFEVKNESNEIFVNEYDDFESDDDKSLSVLSGQACPGKKAKVKKKKKDKVKKVKVKVDKTETVRKKDEEENPETTMDKYKTSDIKRRKPSDGLDESLFTITTLTYEEQIAEVEKRQESSTYKNALYQCTTCFRGFQIRDRYEAHIVRHSEKCGMYECFICKTRLKAARALRKHITAQHTEQFSCKGCPFVTRNRGVAREHEKWHAGTKYQCPHCAMEFDKLTTYMGHIRIKHASDWVCPHCGYTFVSHKGVEVHKRKKHRLIDDNTPLEGPKCDACDVQFASEEAHDRHLKLSSRHMTESDPNRLRNDSQSMNAERNGRVMRRIERRPCVHPRVPGDPPPPLARPVTCEQCGVVLRDLRLYAQHFRRAHPDKNRTKYPAMKTPAMCELCGRIFQSMALLKDHMWVHTGEKRFKCTSCPKSFTQRSNLVFHERVHGGARPSYPCPLCGKHFAFYNNRRRHMFIHTGLKPFKCPSCGKCFTTAGELRAHADHVHMKKPWPKRARKDQMYHVEHKEKEP